MPKIASETFATQSFLHNHLNHKTVNEKTCRTPSAIQLWAHLVEKL